MDYFLALRAFVRIAEAGSLAKAADSMNLPRSSVSKLLQDLESHLGTRLVERTTRALTITDHGAAYHERAVRVLAEVEDMENAVVQERGSPRGRLRVDAGSSLANRVLVPALADFHARYPDIELQLGISDRYVDLIGEGVDCVIRTGVLADSALVARKLCELDWVTCATPDYLARHAAPAVPADLHADVASPHSVVGYFSAASGRIVPLRYQHAGQDLEISPRPAVSVNESTAHLGALLSGVGIGQTYGFMARPHFATGQLLEVLADCKPPNHVLHLVYPANRFASQKLRAFSEWAVALFAQYDQRQR
ncbi:LysR family transcriptional regulator [Silvimonas sp. JCM 19000]